MNEEEIPVPPPQGQPPVPAAPMPEQAAAPPPDAAMGEMQQASPEEQALYNHFVAKAWKLVYDKKTFPKVLKMLEGGGDPIEGLAQAAAMVISRVAGAADKAGQKIPGDVMLNASTEVFEDLAHLSTMAHRAGKAKTHDFEKDQDGLEGAYFRALDAYRVILQGSKRIDKQAAAADMEQLSRMDADGKLEQLFRQLASQEEGAAAAPEDEAPAGLDPGIQMDAENRRAAPRGGGLMQGAY